MAITGTIANYCRGATVQEAFWHSYHVGMVQDPCSSENDDLHRAEIATLRRGHAKIMTAEALLAALGAGAHVAGQGGRA